jgi:3-oxoacyl-[acyl-carrier protein] reductase
MRNVVITGADSTLGLATTRLFLSHGYHVYGCYAHEGARAATLRSVSGVTPLCVDVTSGDGLQALSAVGSVDVLVNNSGVFESYTEKEIPLSAWDKVFDVNIRGLHRVVQRLLPVFAPSGAIVNIASINALHPGFGKTVSYDASKGAVVAYTQSLAAEIAPIRVNAVAPGLLDAPYLHAEGNTVREQFESRALLGRMVKPEEVAQAVLFEAENTAMTGQVIVVDCGYLMG